MKKIYYIVFLTFMTLVVSCAPRERTIVILSTNDMHAQIQNFPKLASAVEACRDTAQIVFLVDAGDRWTGNAYVDLAEGRRPIIDLMNRLEYDVATLGNHEFDAGHKVLGDMIRLVDFPIVCANMQSDTTAVPQTPPYVIIRKDGVKVGFVGVVTNYEGDHHPAGQSKQFVRLNFSDPKQMAREYASVVDQCDVLVLLSHMGTSHDRELLPQESRYDVVIGGHSHEEIDEVVAGTLLTQAGKNLKNIGVTTIRMRGDEVMSVDFRLVPLAQYEAEPEYVAMVERYCDNPDLERPVGELSEMITRVGFMNLVTELIADHTDSDVGFYHVGGIRLDSLAAGVVPMSVVFDIEPFNSQVNTVRMTTEQMRRMIIAKFNDTINTKESHRIDLYSTTPYVIVTDSRGDAVDVLLPDLEPGKSYKVALGDYIFSRYNDLHYTDMVDTGLMITDLLIEEFRDESSIEPDNEPRQRIR